MIESRAVTLTPTAGRLRSRASERALVFFGALVLSGPPRLAARDLETAVESPFTLTGATLLQVFTWVGAGVVVIYLLVTRYARRGGMKSLFRTPLSRRFLLFGLFGAESAVWSVHPLFRTRLSRRYLLFGLFGAVSALWSVNPLYTLFFAAKLAIGVTIVVLLTVHGEKARWDRPLRLLFFLLAVKLIVLVTLFYTARHLVVALTTQSPIGYRLTGGVLLEDYGVSPLFVGLWLLTVALFGPVRRKRRRALVLYVATLYPLLLAQGRMTMMLLIVFSFIMLSLTPASRNKLVVIALGVAGFALIILQGRIYTLIGLVTRGGEGFSDFTGRTVAFDYLIPFWQQSPFIGNGYAAGTRVALLEFPKLSGLGIGSGHDMLSTTLVDVGVVGAVLLAFVLLTMARAVIRLWRQSRGLHRERIDVALLTCLAISTVITCLTGTGIEQHSPHFLVIIAAVWATRSGFPGQVPDRRATNGAVASTSPPRLRQEKP